MSQLSRQLQPASLCNRRTSMSTSLWRSWGEPELSTTMSAYCSFSAIGICDLRREEASSRLKLSRFMSLCSWISGELRYCVSVFTPRSHHSGRTYQYTTTIFPIHFQNPPSIRRGVSRMHIFSPLIQYVSTAKNIAFHTAGCTMLFNFFL